MRHALAAEDGWSGEAMAPLMEECWGDVQTPVKRVCGMRTAVPYPAELEKAVVPSASWIVDGVREVL